MKRFLLILCLNVALAGCKQLPQTSVKERCLADIIRLEQAMQTGDSAMLVKLIHNDFEIGHSNGFTEHKRDFIFHILNGEMKYHSFHPLDTAIFTLIDSNTTAIVRRKVEVAGESFGKPFSVPLNVLEVWVTNGKQWKLLARQAVKIP